MHFASDLKVFKKFLEAILWKPYQLFRRILNDVIRITKALSLQCWFQSTEHEKSVGDRSGQYGGLSSVVTLFFARKSLTKTDRCPGALLWRRNQVLPISPFFGIFSSDRIPNVTKGASVHFFINGSNSISLYQRVPGTFWSYSILSWWMFKELFFDTKTVQLKILKK